MADASPPAELFRPAEETVALDWSRLGAYLDRQGHRLDTGVAPRQFAGGYGNLNFLIGVDGGFAVLRRPPFGRIPPGANDMGREFRVLSVLAPVWPLAPKAIAYCEDTDVLGAPFLISEYRSGLPLHGPSPLGPGMTPAQARRLSGLQIEILSQLHRFDIHEIGAGSLGRTEAFAARTLRGWRKRLDGATAPAPKVAHALFDLLEAANPQDLRRSVIHNDFKLDNVIVDPVTLEPRAVLDWDMSTLGSPFFDLATLLTYWTQPGDPEPLKAIRLTHSDAPGAMTRAELVEAYFAAMGFDAPQDEAEMRFFLALAFAKLGVVCIQLYERFTKDPDQNARNEKFGPATEGAFELGLAAAAGKLI